MSILWLYSKQTKHARVPLLHPLAVFLDIKQAFFENMEHHLLTDKRIHDSFRNLEEREMLWSLNVIKSNI